MKYVTVLILLLAGCCPHRPVEVFATADDRSVEIYDPNDNTIYAFDARGRLVKKFPNWNH